MAATSTPCIFFQQGRCRNGDGCRFSHASTSTSSTSTTTPASALKIRPDPRSQVLCKFYLEGICKQGTNCPYQHEQPSSSSSAQVSPRHAHDTFVRVFRGALVRYGDGACVTSLVLPSEYSSVRLDGLAEGTTTADVIRILEDLGHDVEIDGLRIVAMAQSSLCSAYISTPDLEFSKTLSDSLIDADYRNLKAVPVPPRLPSWASTRRANCNKLSLRWKNPRSECRVYFLTYSAALRVSGKFNSGKYRILNTRIESSEPEPGPVVGLSSIMLLGLPYGCSSGMVEDSIEADYDVPLYVSAVELRRAWKKNIVTLIEKVLTDIGPIDSISEPHQQGCGYYTALARFKQESDAQKAALIIEGASFNSLRDVDLTAKLVYNSTFKISKEVYHHIQKRLEDRIESLGARRMGVIYGDTGIILNIDNWSSEEVAKCANAIEEIVAGDVIEGKDGRPFWVSQLATNGSASKLLKDIQQRHGVLLLPIRSKREIRCFGPVSKQKAVQKDVVQSLTEDVERRHTIDIDDAGFSWLFKTGLDLFKTVMGDNIVSLNVTSSPKKLIITGSDEEYCEILALLEINNISFASKETRSEESCSVCFTPADEPVLLGCGHTYCTDCFRGLCRNGTTQQTDMKVSCTEDQCKNAIPLREIQAHADPSTFEQLLESSFSTYIARRPDQFHYCPTPDCGYIYRPASTSTSSQSHMCPKCLKRICRSCHVNHDGQRCGEHRAFQAFEAYKRENRSNVKDCPKCHTTVEKIDGCNHMQCGGCNIHLCWVCLKMFEESRACYAHMTKVHGGIGIDDDEDEEEVEEEEDDE